MLSMKVKFESDGAWEDLEGRDVAAYMGDAALPIEVGVLPNGMTSGKPSVVLRLEFPDRRVLITETSARLFCSAAKAIMARYPDLFEGE